MMRFIRPRLRVPLAVAIAGTALAAGWAARGGHAWWLAIVIEIGALVRVVMLYVAGGNDSDEGALIGSHADERQRQIARRASALAGNVALIACVIGLSVTVALKTVAAWPFAAVLFVAGLAWAFGFQNATSDDGGADDVSAGYHAGTPASR
jgi:uncharacterized membrane protein